MARRAGIPPRVLHDRTDPTGATLLRRFLTVTAIESKGKRSQSSHGDRRIAGDASSITPLRVLRQGAINLPQRLAELARPDGIEFTIEPGDHPVPFISSIGTLLSPEAAKETVQLPLGAPPAFLEEEDQCVGSLRRPAPLDLSACHPRLSRMLHGPSQTGSRLPKDVPHRRRCRDDDICPGRPTRRGSFLSGSRWAG